MKVNIYKNGTGADIGIGQAPVFKFSSKENKNLSDKHNKKAEKKA